MPEQTPVLNHADFEGNRLHSKKKVGNNDLKTTGWVRGDNLKIGLTVRVTQNTRTWNGSITSGPDFNPTIQKYYWTFTVISDQDSDDPDQDDTVTVTVTNPAANPPSSNNQPANPQPTIVTP